MSVHYFFTGYCSVFAINQRKLLISFVRSIFQAIASVPSLWALALLDWNYLRVGLFLNCMFNKLNNTRLF
jgi:hypothetical protein